MNAHFIPARAEAAAGLLPKTQPEFLRDVLAMKRNRGDADAEQFKELACTEYAYRLNATISGASYTMRRWLAKADKFGWPKDKKDRGAAFLADLDRIIAGDRRGWIAPGSEYRNSLRQEA